MTIAAPNPIETTEMPVSGQKQPKIIGIPKETYANECRVAATPDTAKKLQKLGFEVILETGAGSLANFTDEAYQNADCRIVAYITTLLTEADILLKVRPPSP